MTYLHESVWWLRDEAAKVLWRTRIEHKPFFSLKLFGRPRDIPAKSQDIPPKSLVSLGFEGHTELFDPHPFTWKTPTPPENIRTRKFGVWVPFSSPSLWRTANSRSLSVIQRLRRELMPTAMPPRSFDALMWWKGSFSNVTLTNYSVSMFGLLFCSAAVFGLLFCSALRRTKSANRGAIRTQAR